MILLTVYDLCIWIFRLFFRRKLYLEGRLEVLPPEIGQKWPFKGLCSDHINSEENEHMMKGKLQKNEKFLSLSPHSTLLNEPLTAVHLLP